jgi:hypothetical protein
VVSTAQRLDAGTTVRQFRRFHISPAVSAWLRRSFVVGSCPDAPARHAASC